MVLYEDSRQQPGKHKNIHAYCEQVGIEIIRQALNVGDYMIAGPEGMIMDHDGTVRQVSVDTKMDVGELAMCCFQEHERFRDECLRAQRCGISLVILTEESLPGGLLDNWQSPLGRDGKPLYRINPVTLKKVLLTMQEKYGVMFRFCDGRSTGKMLIEYLKGERK